MLLNKAAVRAHLVAALVLVISLPLSAQYSVHREGEVVRLEDVKNQTVVSILPSVGDVVFKMTVKGQDILRFPYPSIEAFKARPSLVGIPFLGPWANRLDEQGFYANGKHYTFNMTLGNIRGAIPIHGFLTQNPYWEVVEAKADDKAAWVTSRLDFYRHPDWMAQFPFAHTIEITQRLENGVLEVRTRIVNLSTEPMPVSIGFHPYYQLTDSKREDWVISVGARTHWLLAPNKIPTGETTPMKAFFPDPKAAALKDYDLDDVFSDLERDSSGRGSLSVKGKHQMIEVQFGPNYRAAVVYSPDPNKPAPTPPAGTPARPPQDPNFIAFEPMAGITDAMNLAQKGLYKELQSIPPGGSWQESFWVKPSGF
jgi:aldose 1-epimerase